MTTAASATHLHSQLKSARLNYSTCAMDVNVKREYEPACTCGQYLEQFEVNVRTFGDAFHEETTSDHAGNFRRVSEPAGMQRCCLQLQRTIIYDDESELRLEYLSRRRTSRNSTCMGT